LPEDTLRGFKGQYQETVKQLRDGQGQDEAKGNSTNPADQLYFEFVLFASCALRLCGD
jgi:type I restriction enzyme R subunit